MALVYRPAREEDLAPAQDLGVRSINDLTERHGFGAIASVRPSLFQSFCLRDDPDGLWVAAEAGEILGYAFSWVCGDLWFLAELFVAPGHQGRGIGNELLKRTSEQARKAGTTNKALITFPFNLASQGLYIRHQMFPRLLIYNVSAAREVVAGRSPDTTLRHSPIKDSAEHLESLARIDQQALGVSRENHHRHLIRDSGLRGVIFGTNDNHVGYAYVAPTGHIGPLAVARPDLLGDAFKTALHLAAEGSTRQVSAFLPGTNDAALNIAVAHGMRMTFPMLLMSTRDFGNWAQYLPRNPGFM